MMDNTTVVGQIKDQGSTKLRSLYQQTVFFNWVDRMGVPLIPRHVLRCLIVVTDYLLHRQQVVNTEWTLSPQVPNRMWHLWDQPHINLFATRFAAGSFICHSRECMTAHVSHH